MSAVEHKTPGHFVRGENLLETARVHGDDAGPYWKTETQLLSDDDFSYALGAKGATRRKLAVASGCILEVCATRRRWRDARSHESVSTSANWRAFAATTTSDVARRTT
jgi:hypothetical protein